MINAQVAAAEFFDLLPALERPEHTEGREGFYMLDESRGSIEKAEQNYILRDHDAAKLIAREETIRKAAAAVNARYGAGTVTVNIKEQYRNMYEIISEYPFRLEIAKQAVRDCGGEPLIEPIRGGTDGAMLSFKGLPCPNLGTGSGNHHGRQEFACVQDMDKASEQLVKIAEAYGKLKEKEITAYHESGHSILVHVLPDVGPLHTVSIIPTGTGAAGYTMPLPEKDEMFLTRQKMLEEIMVSLGGRIAEELIFGDITTGASSDIKKATQEARSMVTRYGMSANIGVVNYDEEEEDVFIGYDIAHSKKHSELIAGEIDQEVKAIIDDCYGKAKATILEYEDVLHKCADLLLEKEKIGRSEFEALFDQHQPIIDAGEQV